MNKKVKLELSGKLIVETEISKIIELPSNVRSI